MKLADIIATLQKVSQLVVSGAGEAEVILKAVEGDVETVVHSIGVELTGESAGTTVTIAHGTPPPAAEPAPAEPAPVEEPPVDPAAPTG